MEVSETKKTFIMIKPTFV